MTTVVELKKMRTHCQFNIHMFTVRDPWLLSPEPSGVSRPTTGERHSMMDLLHHVLLSLWPGVLHVSTTCCPRDTRPPVYLGCTPQATIIGKLIPDDLHLLLSCLLVMVLGVSSWLEVECLPFWLLAGSPCASAPPRISGRVLWEPWVGCI